MPTIGQRYQMHTGERVLVGVLGVILLRSHTFVGIHEDDRGEKREVRSTFRRGSSWYLTPSEIERNGTPEEA